MKGVAHFVSITLFCRIFGFCYLKKIFLGLMAEDQTSKYCVLFYCTEEIYNFEDFGRRNFGAFRTKKIKFCEKFSKLVNTFRW